MAPPGKFNREKFLKENPGRFDIADSEEQIEGLRKTHGLYFTDELPGPSSTTQAPTDHISTTAPSAGSKRTAEADSSSGSATKKQAHGTGVIPSDSAAVSSTDVEMASLTGTGKEQADIGGNTSMDMVYHIEKPISIFNNRSNVYRKSHKFMTFGLAPNIVTHTTGTAPSAYVNAWLTTYLAEVPWHLPVLYLNQSEFDLLQPGTRVESVSIEVYYRGSTIQFSTASSTTNLATLNQINDIAVAHALNKTGQGSNVSFTSFNSTQTMIPTGVTQPKYEAVGSNYRGMLFDFYGTNNDNTNFVNYIPHHQVGRQTFLYNYWAQSSIAGNGTSLANQLQYGGWPELADKIEQLDGKTCVNQCVLKSHYKPKMGPIKVPLRMYAHGLPLTNPTETNISIPVGGELPRNRIAGYAATTNSSTGITSSIEETENNMSVESSSPYPFSIYAPIEKSQFMRSGVWGDQNAHIQPSIHIGVQPVPSLTTSATITSSTEDGTWTDVRAYWEVIATMVTKEQEPTEYPYATIGNVPFGEVIHQTDLKPAVNLNPRADSATLGGLYSTTAIATRLGSDI